MAIEKELLEGITLLKQEKEEGFNILYSYTYNYVYSRAKYIMKNEEDALDLTQETFVQAYRGISSLEDPNNVYAWLGSITYNQGMKIYRKRKRELLVNEDSESLFEDIVSTDEDLRPEENAQAKATSEIVMSLINELPEVQRAAVVAFYYDNMKIEQIAELFECSANTIKSRLNYARKFLKGKVEEHERQNRYKLCAVSPAIMFMALKSLFASEAYTMAPTVAGNIYAGACGTVGVTASAITAGATTAAQSAAAATGTTTAATGTAATTGTAAATQTAATGAATANAGTAATAATKAGMTIGAKIGITATAIATAGAVTTGALLYANNGEHAEIKAAILADLESRGFTDKNTFDLDAYVNGAFIEDDDNELAQAILDEIISPDMSEFSKVKAIHDYMVMNLDSAYECYNTEVKPETANTAEGTLTTKYGFSSGYAQAFELLCDNAGIECEYVLGTNEYGAVAWNQVKVDEQWYNVFISASDPFYTEDTADDNFYFYTYQYFLVSDEDMYECVPYTPVQKCTSDSIGLDAYTYGCPWMEANSSMQYVKTDEQIINLVREALESGTTDLYFIFPNNLYSIDSINHLLKPEFVKDGYFLSLQTVDAMSSVDRYHLYVHFTLDPDLRRYPVITSDEELNEFVINLAAQENWDERQRIILTHRSDNYDLYLEPALLQGILYSLHYLVEEAPGYYTSYVSITLKDLDILHTTEEIAVKTQEAYDRGLSEYTFVYDYRSQEMDRAELVHTISMAIPDDIEWGQSGYGSPCDGLEIYTVLFRH